MFLADPLSKQHCPTRAACWSPRTAVIGTPLRDPFFIVPNCAAELLISGSIFIGIPKNLSGFENVIDSLYISQTKKLKPLFTCIVVGPI